LLERVSSGLLGGRLGQERALVETLVDAGHDPVEIAAAALRLVRGDEAQRPILPVNEVQDRRPQHKNGRQASPAFDRQPRQRRPRSAPEAGMVSLSLSKGRVHGVRPADVVSTIAYHANIPGHAIGRIHIQDNHTLVDVPEQFVAQVLARSANFRIRRQAIDVARA